MKNKLARKIRKLIFNIPNPFEVIIIWIVSDYSFKETIKKSKKGYFK